MNVTQRWALCALLFGAASSALAQDEIVLGSPLRAAPGEVVRVPVFIRDVAGTPLGAGGAPIQWIDLSVTHSHPHLVVGCLGTTYPNCDLQFEAAGVLATSPPETSGTLINIASLYVRRIFGQALSFNTGELELIGVITFRLDPNVPPGTVVRLQFDPAKTFLANHDGTIVDRGLKLTEVELCLDPPNTPSFGFFGPVSGCSAASSPFSPCRADEDVEFTTAVPIDPCDTLTWSFGDGSAVTNGSTVRHRFTLPATYTVTATVTRASGSAALSRQVSIVPGCTVSVPNTPSFGFFGLVSECSSAPPVSPAVFIPCRAGEDVEFTTFTPIDSCDTLRWSFGDGTLAFTNSSTVRHRFTLPGTYNVFATVTRASGSAVFSRQVSIVPGCTATVPETAVAGTPVLFMADTLPPGLATFVSWKFGDGTTGSGNPMHTYQFGVTYLWEATVSVAGTQVPCIVRRPIAVSGPPPPKRRAAP